MESLTNEQVINEIDPKYESEFLQNVKSNSHENNHIKLFKF